MANAFIDQNHKPSLIAVSSVDEITPVLLHVHPITHKLLTSVGKTPVALYANSQGKILIQTTQYGTSI